MSGVAPNEAEAGLPETPLSRLVDAMVRKLGMLAGWLWLLLLAVILLNVVLRYVFGEGRIELEEMQWHIYAVGFLLGITLGVSLDDHVRVDVLAARWTTRTRAWVELYGILFLLVPFLAMVLIDAVPFVMHAYALNEASPAPGGLPLRWLIKAALPVVFFILAAAVLGRLSRVCALLFGWPKARAGVRS